MQEIFQQVGAQFLGAIPSLILFIFLVVAYQLLVQGPLAKVLRERRARTSGAVEAAAQAIAMAERRTAEYGESLRQARAELFRQREQRLQQWSEERDAALAAARHAASTRVEQARVAIAAETDSARATLASGVEALAQQVLQAVLPATAGGAR